MGFSLFLIDSCNTLKNGRIKKIMNFVGNKLCTALLAQVYQFYSLKLILRFFLERAGGGFCANSKRFLARLLKKPE